MKRIPNSNMGFTLVELLVVSTIIATVGFVFSSSFIALMGGSKKADIVSEVKQNGNFALSVMEQLIRNSLPSSSCTPTSVTINNSDGGTTTFACIDIDGVMRIASNSSALTSRTVRVVECSFVCPTPVPASPAGVNISFTLEQNLANVTPRPGERSRQQFETTVFQRNY